MHPALRVACEELRRSRKEEAKRIANETAAIERRVKAAMGLAASRVLQIHAPAMNKQPARADSSSASSQGDGRTELERLISAIETEERAREAIERNEKEAALMKRVEEATASAEKRGYDAGKAEAEAATDEAVRAAVNAALKDAAAKSEAAVNKVIKQMSGQLQDPSSDIVKQMVEPLRRQNAQLKARLAQLTADQLEPAGGAEGAKANGTGNPAASSWFGGWI